MKHNKGLKGPHRFPDRVEDHKARQKEIDDMVQEVLGHPVVQSPPPSPPRQKNRRVNYSQSFPRSKRCPKLRLAVKNGNKPSSPGDQNNYLRAHVHRHRISSMSSSHSRPISPHSPQNLQNQLSPNSYHSTSPFSQGLSPNCYVPSASPFSQQGLSPNYCVPSPSNFPPTPNSSQFGSQNQLFSPVSPHWNQQNDQQVPYIQDPNRLSAHSASNWQNMSPSYQQNWCSDSSSMSTSSSSSSSYFNTTFVDMSQFQQNMNQLPYFPNMTHQQHFENQLNQDQSGLGMNHQQQLAGPSQMGMQGYRQISTESNTSQTLPPFSAFSDCLTDEEFCDGLKAINFNMH